MQSPAAGSMTLPLPVPLPSPRLDADSSAAMTPVPSATLLLPSRLAQLERDRRASPSAGGSLAPSPLATPTRSRSSSAASDSDSVSAAEQQQQLQFMLAALRNEGEDEEQTSPTTLRARRNQSPDGVDRSPPPAAAAATPEDSDELDYDDHHVEEEQRLYAKRSPLPEEGGKGAGAGASPRPTVVSPVERARIVNDVLRSLDQTQNRAYTFGPADQQLLTEAIRERSLDFELAVQQADEGSVGAQKDVKRAGATMVSDADVAAYLTSAPLLYSDSDPIVAPKADVAVPLHSDSNQARRVYQQMIQALFIHSSMADFHRVPVPLSPDARRRAESRAESRRRRHQARQQDDVSRGDSESDCDDCDEDEVPTAVSSLTYEAAQLHAKDPNLPAPLSPLDPSHPALKSLLLTVEAAFDAADRTTRAYAAPFQRSVRTNLLLARSVMRMHQARLDNHPTHTLQSFTTVPLFNSWYTQENALLNARMNEIAEQIAFEQAHPRPDEEARRKAEEEANRSKSLSGVAATSAPKRKSSFWSCCSCGTAEPDISEEARMQSKSAAVAAATAEADESVVRSWQSDDFSEGMDVLIRVLLQYEHTLDAEIDRQEEMERQRNAKMLHPSQIDVADLKHPDELEAEAAQKADASDADAIPSPGADADDEELHVPIYMTRTLNPGRVRPLTAASLRLIAIYADVWRISLPHSSTSTLSLYANNLNANNPAFYSACTNQLTMIDALYSSHLTLARGAPSGSKAAPRVPFTKAEMASYKASVRGLFEWVALSLQRYHLVFARTRESMQRDGLLPVSPGGGAGAASPELPDPDSDESMDGLRECLYLFDKLLSTMRQLKMPVHTSSMEGAAAAAAAAAGPDASPSPDEPRPTAVAALKKLVDVAITTRYSQLVESTKPSDALAAEVAAAEAAAMLSSPKLRQHLSDEPPLSVKHVSHLSRLLKAVTTELHLDIARSQVFQEVIKERVDAPSSPKEAEAAAAAADSSARRAHRPSSADLGDPQLHSSGFDLAQVSAATLLTFVWHDCKYLLLMLRMAHGELSQQSHRSKSQAAALASVNGQLRGIVRLYPQLHALYSLVSRTVANLPDLRARCTPWFDWAITAWIAQLQSEYASDANGNRFQELVGADTFVVDLASSPVRYSPSVVSLFALLWPLGRAFKAAPYTQRHLEEFADLVSGLVSRYVRTLHGDMSHVLDQEKRKKLLWGTAVGPVGPNGAPPEVELSLPPSMFVRFNNMLLCKLQLRALLDELGLAQAWTQLLSSDETPAPAPELKRDDSPSASPRSPDTQVHTAQSPVVARAELPSAQEKNASAGALARNPVTSPLSPSPSPTGVASSNPLLPLSVQTSLDCRSAFDTIGRSVDELLLRMTGGLGAFIEHQLSSVIHRSTTAEWTGRHTRQEIEPLFAYLQKHLDHTRAYLYDRLFCRLLFFVLSDVVLILEKELVHPRKQSYKQRLRTEQVHRVVQMHYLTLDFVRQQFHLPDDYMQRLKAAHLNRLEYLETLLTGGSDALVDEFRRIDEAADEAAHRLPFAEREAMRLQRAPHLSRRQLAGIIRFRAEFEGDHSVTDFISKHKSSGWFSSNNFFQ